MTDADRPATPRTRQRSFPFVASEYGDGGSVGVLSWRERGGRLTSAELVNTLSTPRTAPGLALSPDHLRHAFRTRSLTRVPIE